MILPLLMSMQKRMITIRKMLAELDGVENIPVGFFTIYTTPQSFPGYILSCLPGDILFPEQLKIALANKNILREASFLSTGAVIFWSEEYKKIIFPPFPVQEDAFSIGRPVVFPLRSLLEREYTCGIVLIAWGTYAAGIFKGDRLLGYKKGTGHIHKKHRKGGSSQMRFARRIDEQRRSFLVRASKNLEELFKAYQPDWILYGGNRLLLKPLIEEVTYLRSNPGRISIRFPDVRTADRGTLLGKAEDISSSIMFDFD